MERECVEERCSKEEAREVFENDPETVSCVGNHHVNCGFPAKAACSFPPQNINSRLSSGSINVLQYLKPN